MIFSSYIIHIYRFRKNNPRALVGVVEEIGSSGKKAFTNYDELWEIISSQISINSSFKGKGEICKKVLFKKNRAKGGDKVNKTLKD